jgi:hypothetical protein
MKKIKDHDALAEKKRFVQSLTHSHRYLNDAHFLTPVSKKAADKTNHQPAPQQDQPQTTTNAHETNNHQEGNSYY